jgi:hypothetical protein
MHGCTVPQACPDWNPLGHPSAAAKEEAAAAAATAAAAHQGHGPVGGYVNAVAQGSQAGQVGAAPGHPCRQAGRRALVLLALVAQAAASLCCNSTSCWTRSLVASSRTKERVIARPVRGRAAHHSHERKPATVVRRRAASPSSKMALVPPTVAMEPCAGFPDRQAASCPMFIAQPCPNVQACMRGARSGGGCRRAQHVGDHRAAAHQVPVLEGLWAGRARRALVHLSIEHSCQVPSLLLGHLRQASGLQASATARHQTARLPTPHSMGHDHQAAAVR